MITTPQARSGPWVAKLWMILVMGGCSAPRRPVVASIPLMVVAAPAGPQGDDPANLVNGTVEPYGWHCAEGAPPFTYEFMFADDEVRNVHTVGIVIGNTGSHGVGDLDVRVQRGHGAIAQGETFRATLAGRRDGLRWIELPHAVSGDHVLLTFAQRPASTTALCLAEVVVPDERHAIDRSEAVSARAIPADASMDSAAPVDDATPQ